MEENQIQDIINANSALVANNQLLSETLKDLFTMVREHHQAREELFRLTAKFYDHLIKKKEKSEAEQKWIENFYQTISRHTREASVS